VKVDYYVGGVKRRVVVPGTGQPAAAPGGWSPAARRAEALATVTPGPRGLAGPRSLAGPPAAPAPAGRPRVLPTRTLALGGARTSEVSWLRQAFGLEVVQEGTHGKVLLGVPPDVADPVGTAARASVAVYERGVVASAQPNFVRLLSPPTPAGQGATSQWGLDNPGSPGVVGADVAAAAAWTVTEGTSDVRLAVLDDGVETSHPYLAAAVVAERDFVDGRATAAPDAGSAHGTRCAGIAVSRDGTVRGLAPGVGLVACRIMANSPQGWVLDDFQAAEGIDWCWDEGRADILSNSWGDTPSDLIGSAFERARTQGRGGKGCVVVVAAGNDEGPVRFPGSLPDVLTVGATNEWDERKTTRSRDGESTWGSNVGKGLDVMAPGVHILTADLTAPGRDGPPTTGRFNGTSAATPFAAAAAALVMSVAPGLTEAQVRQVLVATTDSLGPTRWNRFVGFGRLNVYRAVRLARRGGVS
jgi:subtilisin family serine protease